MANIIIIGAGVMSCSFTLPCNENNHETLIIGSKYGDKIIDTVNANNNFHPSLKVNLSKKNKFIKYEDLSKEKFKSIDLVVIGTNSKGLEWSSDVVETICSKKNIPPILLLTKGIHVYKNKFEVFIEKITRILNNKNFTNINISAIAGPCLANELAAKIHSSVVITNRNIKNANLIKNLLETDYYHISLSNDINGIEVCAAIKNIYSIAIGSAKNNHNTAAALFNQSIHEMEILVSFLNGKKETVKGLAGVGDLYVSSKGGRNSLLGSYLGGGLVYSDVKKNQMKDITVEGAELAFEIYESINNSFNVKQLPLMFAVIEAIVKNKKIEIEWEFFN